MTSWCNVQAKGKPWCLVLKLNTIFLSCVLLGYLVPHKSNGYHESKLFIRSLYALWLCFSETLSKRVFIFILCPVRYEFIHKTLWLFCISFWSCCLSCDLFTRIRAGLTGMCFATGDSRWTTVHKKAGIWWRDSRASTNNCTETQCLEGDKDLVIHFVAWEFKIGVKSKSLDAKYTSPSSTAADGTRLCSRGFAGVAGTSGYRKSTRALKDFRAWGNACPQTSYLVDHISVHHGAILPCFHSKPSFWRQLQQERMRKLFNVLDHWEQELVLCFLPGCCGREEMIAGSSARPGEPQDPGWCRQLLTFGCWGQ